MKMLLALKYVRSLLLMLSVIKKCWNLSIFLEGYRYSLKGVLSPLSKFTEEKQFADR